MASPKRSPTTTTTTTTNRSRPVRKMHPQVTTSVYRTTSPGPTRCLPPKTHALQPLSHSMSKVSDIFEASMDIVNTVRARWTRQEKRTVARSIGYQHLSSDRSSHLGCDDAAGDETHSAPLEDVGLPVKPSHCRRVVVLGAPGVGKTNVVRRFLGLEFEERYEPTAEDFHRKLYHIRGETYQVDVLDAAGERDYPAKRRLSILTGDIFLLVFSVNVRESFDEVCDLRDDIRAAKTKLMKLKDTARASTVIICGNKADLLGAEEERAVDRTDMRHLLGEDALLFETSAKVGTGLEDMFRALATAGGLPTETGPSQHQTLSIHDYQSLLQERRGSRGFDAPCAALYPLARRPSFTSDLQRVVGPSPNKPEKCQIQ